MIVIKVMVLGIAQKAKDKIRKESRKLRLELKERNQSQIREGRGER